MRYSAAIDSGRGRLATILMKAAGILLMVCALATSLVSEVRAQGGGLPADHFLADSLAESAKVYESRIAARQAQEAKQWELAISHWDRLLKLWPDDLEALSGKARILSDELARPEAALEVRGLATKAAPWSPDSWYQLCELNFQAHRFQQALEDCDTSLLLLRRNLKAMLRRADILAVLGKSDQLETQYKQFVSILEQREHVDALIEHLNSLRKSHPQLTERHSKLPEQLMELWGSGEILKRRNARSELNSKFIEISALVGEGDPKYIARLDPKRLALLAEEAESVDGANAGDALEIRVMLSLLRGLQCIVNAELLCVSIEMRKFEEMLASGLGRAHQLGSRLLDLKLATGLVSVSGGDSKENAGNDLTRAAELIYGRHSKEVATQLWKASRSYQVAGRTDSRTISLARSLTILVGQEGPRSKFAADGTDLLVTSLLAAGENRSAVSLQRIQVARNVERFGDRDPITLRSRHTLGAILIYLEDFQAGVEVLEDAHRAVVGTEGNQEFKSSVESSLAMAYERLGKEEDAKRLRLASSNRPSTANTGVSETKFDSLVDQYGLNLIDEADRLERVGRSAEAYVKYQIGRSNAAQIFGAQHPMLAAIDWRLAVYENSSARHNAALARLDSVLDVANVDQDHPYLIVTRLLWIKAQSEFALRRERDASDTLIKYWAMLSRFESRSVLSAEALFSLSVLLQRQGKSAASTYAAKFAVNIIQHARANMRGLSDDSQRSFLQKHGWGYRALASVLIERGRVIEAEQVLQMLKELELRELTPRSKVGESVQVTRVDLGGAEQRVQRRMDALLDEGAGLQEDLTRTQRRLRLLQGDETDNRQRVLDLEAKLQTWEATMRAFLDNLPKELPDVQVPGGEQDNEKAKGRLQAVIQRDPTAVGLQFVVTDERLGILLASREGTVGRFSPITRVELSQRVSQLRTAILNKADTREAAQALWKALLGPVEADLQRLGARTLLLASTDVLRYLPFAALQDEQGHYLIERFALANWLAAAPDPKPRAQTQPWRMAALGVTQAKPGFPALPGVRREIQGIVRSPINPGGALPGYAYLDDEFDLQHLDEAIGGAGNIVHVASHFDFRPGDERRSVLLVGRGDPVSMASLARRDFAKVEQLTLSACETATGGGFNETGAEVEGLAALLLVKQARSVMGTLWKVADASTAQLMVSYYRQMQSGRAGQVGPLPGRAAALQAAQLQLLKGQGASVTDKSARGARPLAAGTPSPTAPSPDNPWAHPYYWAPFVISGDWM